MPLIDDFNRSAGLDHRKEREQPEPMEPSWGAIIFALGWGVLLTALICLALFVRYLIGG